jgi:hypothetical protein
MIPFEDIDSPFKVIKIVGEEVEIPSQCGMSKL